MSGVGRKHPKHFRYKRVIDDKPILGVVIAPSLDKFRSYPVH